MLAVTSQNAGDDGVWATLDDLYEPINKRPASVSVDNAPGDNCDDPLDRVRGFFSFHPTGANFVFADGSVHFLNTTIDRTLFQALSTYNGREIAFLRD